MRKHDGVALGVGLVSLVLLLGTKPAIADMVPPDQYACQAKQDGDACTVDGKAGRCQTIDGCVTKDLAHWDRDASTYPPIITYACPQCVPSPDDGGCAIAASSPLHRFGPWVLAASFSLLFLFARRRRR